MKKILEKLCSVRVILTVLCLLSFVMEARADIADMPREPIAQLTPQLGCLQIGIIISLLVICSSALGYYSEKMKPVICFIRFIQVLLLGVFFLMWGLFLIHKNAFDFPDFVCLVILMAVTICTCLFSGIWTKWKITPATLLYGILVFWGIFIIAGCFGWGLIMCANVFAASLLLLTVVPITVAMLILGFIMKRKHKLESNSENSNVQLGCFADNPAPANGKADSADAHVSGRNEVYRQFVLFAIFLFTDLLIILGIEFVYLPYCAYKEKTNHTIEKEIKEDGTVFFYLKKGESVTVSLDEDEDNTFRSYQWVAEYYKNLCSVELEHCKPERSSLHINRDRVYGNETYVNSGRHRINRGYVKVTMKLLTDQKAEVKLKLMNKRDLPWEDSITRDTKIYVLTEKNFWSELLKAISNK